MSKKGILVSYLGPHIGVDLSGMAKDADRLNFGSTLSLSRRCTKTLSKAEMEYIQEKHKDVAKLFTVHGEVDPKAEGKKKPSRGHGDQVAVSVSVVTVVKKKKAAPPSPPPTPPSLDGDGGTGGGGKKGKKK